VSASIQYRVYFGPNAVGLMPATAEQLARIEQIVVEQEIDLIWEAQITMHLCLDEDGRWQHLQESFAQPFSRMRIELQVGSQAWTPLIDGPITSSQTSLDSQPGRSVLTLVVRDDSVFLNRTERTRAFPEGSPPLPVTDALRVQQLLTSEFSEYIAPGAEIVIESDEARIATQRGTAYQFLRDLARADGCRAYVLPALTAKLPSRFCFKADPRTPGLLPPLVLLGADRNLSDVEIVDNAEGPQRTTGSSLRISDGEITSYETSQSDLALMREEPGIADDATALRELPATDNIREDPRAAATAASRDRSYQFRLTGRVLSGCYGAAIQPYELVTLQAGDTRYSGVCLIRRVTHTLTRDAYTQEFEALIDSTSPTDGATGLTGPGGLSVSFSASLSIF
jgi:hypothetical protein